MATLRGDYLCAAAPDPPVPTTDPDPNGDAIFLVGELRLLIKVCSKVIEFTSPAFKSMLSPRFLPRPLSVDNPPEILLPDDDPYAMLWFCTVMHHQPWPNGNLSTSMVKKIAVLSEKYDLATALRPWSSKFLYTFAGDAGLNCRFLGISHWETMWMARAFDNQDAFTLSTRHHVWHAGRVLRPSGLDENTDPASVEAVGLSMLPVRIWDTLKGIRTELGRSLNFKIDSIIEPYLAPTMCTGQNAFGGEQYATACARSERVLHFFHELHRLNVWPLRQTLYQQGLGWVSRQLQGFENSPWVTQSGDCTCLIDVDFKNEIIRALGQMMIQPAHLCLNCIKSGFVSAKEGNCIATTTDQCKTRPRSLLPS